MEIPKTKKYGNYDVDQNWNYLRNAARGMGGAELLVYNSKDPTQKFLTGNDVGLQEFLTQGGRKAEITADEANPFSGQLTRNARGGIDAKNWTNLFSGEQLSSSSPAFSADAMTRANRLPIPRAEDPASLRGIPSNKVVTLKDGTILRGQDALNYGRTPITSSQGKSPIELAQAIQNQNAPAFNFTGILKSGSSGADVSSLQQLLGGLTVDGKFGPKTQAAVIAFQKANGLTPDGKVGPLTVAALNKKNQPTQQPIYDNKTGFLTDYGVSIGAKAVNPNDPSKTTASGGATTGTEGVGTSGSARTDLKNAQAEAEKIFGERPEAPDLFSSKDEKNLAIARNDKTAIETELADIQGAKMALEDEFRKYKVQSAKEISQAGYEGGLSEKSRELQFQSDTLARKEFVLETKLQSRNDTINELMKNQELDYASAVEQYNTQFSQSLQLYGILQGQQDELRINALASADLMINSIKDNPTAFSNPTQSQLRKWSEYEMQAGLPEGYIQSIAKVASQANGFEYKGTIGGAESGYSSIWINPTTGEQKIMKISGGTGGGGKFQGFSGADVVAIKNDIATYGIDTVLEGITDPDEVKAIQALETKAGDKTKLTRSNVSSLYGIPDDDTKKKEWFGGFNVKTGKEQLDELMSFITRYQDVGYSDEQILKLMQEKE